VAVERERERERKHTLGDDKSGAASHLITHWSALPLRIDVLLVCGASSAAIFLIFLTRCILIKRAECPARLPSLSSAIDE